MAIERFVAEVESWFVSLGRPMIEAESSISSDPATSISK
jgi:hypothetical protein